MTAGGGRLLRATVLVSIAHYGTLATTVLTQLAFARLVSPSEIGAYAIAFGFTEIVGAVIDLPINRAVITRLGGTRDSESTRAELGTAWVIVIAQMLAFLLLAGGAGLLSAWGRPWANPRIAALAGLLLAAKGLSKAGFLVTANDEHEVRFGTISAVTLATTIAGGVVAVLAASRGLGGTAVALRDLLSAGLYSLVTVWVFRARLTLAWSAERAAALVRYSARLAISGLTDRLVTQMDTLLLGRTIDLASVGVYSYARRLVGLGINACLPAIQRVLFAAYAAPSSPEVRLHRTASRWIFGVAAVGTLVLVLFPSEVVRIALGQGFAEAARPLGWLAPLLLVSLVAENDRTFLIARGKFRGLIVVRYVQCAGVGAAVLVATSRGAVAVVATCVAVVAGELLSLVLTRMWVVERLVEHAERAILVLTVVAAVGGLSLAASRLAQAPLLHRAVVAAVGPVLVALALGGARLRRSEAP
jgi:O-antigen/teichoic acid export membrane protein